MRLEFPATAERRASNLLKLEKAPSRIPPTNRPFCIAPAYSEQRRAMAKKIGLGRKPGAKVAGRKASAK